MATVDMTNVTFPHVIRLEALEMALSQVGAKEKPIGSNSGPEVDQYLKSVGLGPGYAWCQAFVYWSYNQAAGKLGIANPVVHTGGVLDCWNKTAVNFKITKADAMKHPELILPGYQFILSYSGGAGHTGIIEKVEGHIMYTIEGNSNENGGREGYEVVRHQRPINSNLLKGIIKY